MCKSQKALEVGSTYYNTHTSSLCLQLWISILQTHTHTHTYTQYVLPTHTQEEKHLRSVGLSCTLYKPNLCTNRHIHPHKHNKNAILGSCSFTLLYTHGTHQPYSYRRNTTWSIEWACCLDERRFNRKVSIFVEGHGNVNAPQLAKGSQSSRVSHNEGWQTQRAFQQKPLCDKHFHFKGFILQDVMSIYFYIMSAVVRRQLGECKKGDQICHCCRLIRGHTGAQCVCQCVSQTESTPQWVWVFSHVADKKKSSSVALILSLHALHTTLSDVKSLGGIYWFKGSLCNWSDCCLICTAGI